MSKLILNNIEFEIDNFSHNTHYHNNIINDTIVTTTKDNFDRSLVGKDITYLAIKNTDNEKIYELNNLNAKLISAGTTLTQDSIQTNISIVINME